MDPTLPHPSEKPWPTWLVGSLALVLVLGLQLLEPLFFLRDDNASQFFPAYVYSFESLADQHELPLLNQHQDMGSTFLATGQTGVFVFLHYPLQALLRAFGADASYLMDCLATLHLMLAALGMWALLRHFEVRREIALPLALCWCLLPFGVIAGRCWIFVTYLMAFLPFNLLLLMRFLERPSARLLALWVALKSLFLLGGDIHLMVLATLYEGVFLLVRGWLLRRGGLWRGGRGRAEAAAVTMVFGLTALLGLPLLLPMLEARAASSYRSQAVPVEDALAYPLEPLDFLAAQVFLPKTDHLFYTGSTMVFFLGPPLLWALALAWRRRRELGAPLWAAFGAGFFALAMSTVLYWLLYQLPVFGSLRFPFKSFPFAAFFLFPVLASGAAAWAASSRKRLLIAAGLFWLNLGLQVFCLLPPSWRSPFVPFKLDRSLAELRSAPLLAKIGDQARVATLSSAADPPPDSGPLRLGFLYATLAGKYQVQGYNPLLADINDQLTFPVENDGEIRVREAGWEVVRRRLRATGARYLLLSDNSRLLPLIEADPALRRLATDEGLALLEDTATPQVVHRMEDLKPLPFRWRTNGLELDLPADFAGGNVLVNVAALGGYRWWLDGQPQGPPKVFERRPYLELPPGPGRVELRYLEPRLTWGLLGAVLGLALLLYVMRNEERLAACFDRERR